MAVGFFRACFPDIINSCSLRSRSREPEAKGKELERYIVIKAVHGLVSGVSIRRASQYY